MSTKFAITLKVDIKTLQLTLNPPRIPMTSKKVLSYIEVKQNSRIPKYKQIVNSILTNIANGNFSVNDRIPSINELSEEFYLSRDTVEKAYNLLKSKKVISSIPGKGSYISSTELVSKINVFFLINKLSSYKLKVYQSFIDRMGDQAHIDLNVYHCDETMFLNLLDKNIDAYDYFVIMPHFKTDDLKHVSFTEKTLEAVNKIPDNKLIIMDNIKSNPKENAAKIYQNFQEDLFDALVDGLEIIQKYENLILIYPENSLYPYPMRITRGFKQFCVQYGFEYEIINEVYEDMELKAGDLYISIEESDLVSLIKLVRKSSLELGKDVGIICYNDTPLKELLGITAVSTDFAKMGETAADMILENKFESVKNPFFFINRKST